MKHSALMCTCALFLSILLLLVPLLSASAIYYVPTDYKIRTVVVELKSSVLEKDLNYFLKKNPGVKKLDSFVELFYGFSADVTEEGYTELQKYAGTQRIFEVLTYEKNAFSSLNLIPPSVAHSEPAQGGSVSVALLSDSFTDTGLLPVAYSHDFSNRDDDVSYGSSGSAALSSGTAMAYTLMQNNAPVQLYCMKVYPDQYNTTDTAALCAALEQAVRNKVDLICLDAAESSGREDDPLLTLCLSVLNEKGIPVLSAAGESGVSGSMADDNSVVSARTAAANSDPGTLSSPAASPYVITVASADSGFDLDLNTGIYGKRSEPFPVFNASVGITRDRLCKPDVCAIGNHVRIKTGNGAEYSVSGGAVAVASLASELSVIMNDEIQNGKNVSSFSLRSLFTASSQPLNSKDSELLESPRRMGNGIFTADRISPYFLASDGVGKVLEGHKEQNGFFSIPFTISNTTGKQHAFTLSCELNTDEICFDEGFGQYITTGKPASVTEAAVRADGNPNNLLQYAADYKPLTFAVEADSTLHMTLTIKLSDAFLNDLKAAFRNGAYLDGFLQLSDWESGEILSSLPFVGFTGDIASIPAWDATIYDEEMPVVSPSAFLAELVDFDFSPILGGNAFEEKTEYDSSRVVFSPGFDANADKLYLRLSVLSDLCDVSATVTDSDGKTVHRVSVPDELFRNRTLYDNLIEVWDGAADDNSSYYYPAGLYYLTIKACVVRTGRETSLSLPFRIDRSAPVLVSAAIGTKDGKRVLNVTASDETMLQAALLYQSGEAFETGDIQTQTASPGSSKQVFSFSLPNDAPDVMYLDLVDSAFHCVTFKLRLSALQ